VTEHNPSLDISGDAPDSRPVAPANEATPIRQAWEVFEEGGQWWYQPPPPWTKACGPYAEESEAHYRVACQEALWEPDDVE